MRSRLIRAARLLGILAVAGLGVLSIIAKNGNGSGDGDGSDGAVQYRQIDCKAADIGFAVTSSNRQSSGNQYLQRIEVTVTCNGAPVPDADVKFELWIGDPTKGTTNSQGKATWRNRAHADATGSSFTLTVLGTDEDGDADPHSETFTFNQ